MTLYLLLSALIFAVSAGITFATKRVSNTQFVFCLLLFPMAYIASGLPLANITHSLLAAVIVFIISFFLAMKRHIGGGAARAFTIIALWMPTSMLTDGVTTILILTGAASACLLYMDTGRKNFEHFSGLAMVICAGFFGYQYYETRSVNAKPYDVQAGVEAQAPSALPINLRGSSNPKG